MKLLDVPAVTMVTASDAGRSERSWKEVSIEGKCWGSGMLWGGCPHKIFCVTTGRYSGRDGGCIQSYEASIKVTSHYLISKWSFGSVTTILGSYM